MPGIHVGTQKSGRIVEKRDPLAECEGLRDAMVIGVEVSRCNTDRMRGRSRRADRATPAACRRVLDRFDVKQELRCEDGVPAILTVVGLVAGPFRMEGT
jgi:hypothetical protein